MGIQAPFPSKCTFFLFVLHLTCDSFSPVYALRPYLYVAIHSTIGKLFLLAGIDDKVKDLLFILLSYSYSSWLGTNCCVAQLVIFLLIRCVLGAFCAWCESIFYRGVTRKFGGNSFLVCCHKNSAVLKTKSKSTDSATVFYSSICSPRSHWAVLIYLPFVFCGDVSLFNCTFAFNFLHVWSVALVRALVLSKFLPICCGSLLWGDTWMALRSCLVCTLGPRYLGAPQSHQTTNMGHAGTSTLPCALCFS